jgi:hypothetical protein
VACGDLDGPAHHALNGNDHHPVRITQVRTGGGDEASPGCVVASVETRNLDAP